MEATITIRPIGEGSVTLKPKGRFLGPGQVAYPTGTTLTLTAQYTGEAGYFDHWEGDVSSQDNPVSIKLDYDATIVPVFVAVIVPPDVVRPDPMPDPGPIPTLPPGPSPIIPEPRPGPAPVPIIPPPPHFDPSKSGINWLVVGAVVIGAKILGKGR